VRRIKHRVGTLGLHQPPIRRTRKAAANNVGVAQSTVSKGSDATLTEWRRSMLWILLVGGKILPGNQTGANRADAIAAIG